MHKHCKCGREPVVHPRFHALGAKPTESAPSMQTRPILCAPCPQAASSPLGLKTLGLTAAVVLRMKCGHFASLGSSSGKDLGWAEENLPSYPSACWPRGGGCSWGRGYSANTHQVGPGSETEAPVTEAMEGRGKEAKSLYRYQ